MFKGLKVPEQVSNQKQGESNFRELHFTNFKLGTKTVGVFVGEPIEVFKHYEGKYPNSTYLGMCTGENCLHCQSGNTPKYSIRINFLTVVNGTPTMTIGEGPASLARALSNMETDTEDPEFFTNKVVLINRTDKTAFGIVAVKPPKELANLKAIMEEQPPFDLKAIIEAQIKKQTAGQDTTTAAPF